MTINQRIQNISKKLYRPYEGIFGSKQSGWEPGPNTIAYYPMDEDLLDHSDNHLTTTVSGTVTIGTAGGVNAGDFSSVGGLSASISETGDLTAMCWIYKTGDPNNDSAWIIGYGRSAPSNVETFGTIYAKTRPEVVDDKPCATVFDFITYRANTFPHAPIDNDKWYHIAATFNRTSGLVNLYINGAFIGSYTSSGKDHATNLLYISRRLDIDRSWIGYMSNAIFENKEWTAGEIEAYFTQTKSLYGVS